MECVKKCDICQRFADVHKAPPEQLHSIMSPWSFHKWGVDILGPFPIATSGTSPIEWISRGSQQGHFERVAKTIDSTTNKTPFRLTFGIEAMIPVEIGEPSPWTTLF
ncbi:hypothetical protein CR513_27934, partial [Mucuna pruriens]